MSKEIPQFSIIIESEALTLGVKIVVSQHPQRGAKACEY